MALFDDKLDRKILAECQAIHAIVKRNHHLLLEIQATLARMSALTFARVIIVPKTIQVGQTAQAAIQGLDQNGQPFPLDSTYQVVYTASSPSDVTITTPNPDGSATITGVNPNPGIQVGATITKPDGSTVTATPDTLVIQAVTPTPVLTSASVVLS